MLKCAFHKVSSVDYPGNVASVIFFGGCDLDCIYCHNRSLLNENKTNLNWTVKEVIKYLEKRKGEIEGVVLTGGEPLLKKNIGDLIRQFKNMGFLVKLDTNGFSPYALREVVEDLDYVAIDIKGPEDKYPTITGENHDLSLLYESLKICVDKCEFETRTTVFPLLNFKDLVYIVNNIVTTIGSDAKHKHFIQQYCKVDWLDIDPYNSDLLKKWVRELQTYYNRIYFR